MPKKNTVLWVMRKGEALTKINLQIKKLQHLNMSAAISILPKLIKLSISLQKLNNEGYDQVNRVELNVNLNEIDKLGKSDSFDEKTRSETESIVSEVRALSPIHFEDEENNQFAPPNTPQPVFFSVAARGSIPYATPVNVPFALAVQNQTEQHAAYDDDEEKCCDPFRAFKRFLFM